ncbi:MAG TPA: hypothetical protein VJQ79_09040, partial [Acidimicrobiia bacterium]|nr:hypothetical protein [Acidimicrobiia bacterium]
MTLDQIDQMVRQANPVPDLTVLEPVDASVLVLNQQRRTDMQTHDRVEVDQDQDQSKRGLLVGIAAAAAIVVGVLVWVRPMVAPVAAAPVEVATAFVEAYAAFDADKAVSYLTDSAVAEFGGFDGDLEDLPLGLRQGQAAGFQWLFDTCEVSGSSPSGALVRCAYAYHGIRSDEIGLGPYTGSWFDITVLDGKIVSVSDQIQYSSNGFSSEMWEPFASWVAETYPDDVAVMYKDSSQAVPSITEESNQLWELRTREYVGVAQQRAVGLVTAFIDAYSAFDVDAAAALLAADADVSRLEAGVEGWHLGNRWLEAVGFKVVLDSCAIQTDSPPGTVRCLFAFHAIRSDEIGLGPFGGSRFEFRIVGGEIASASMMWNIEEFGPQVWEPFATWLAETYPDDVTV